MERLEFASADSADEESIARLLSESGLPHEDIGDHLRHFIVAKSGRDLVGVVGLEVPGEFGLLRSLAVAPPHRGRRIGTMLYERILAHAHVQGIKELYLLTTTAEGFFSRLGFIPVERNNVPQPIQATEEFQRLCPSTAACMSKRIDSSG